MKYKAILFFGFFLLITLSACKYQKLLKKGSVDEKYETAIRMYNEKDYSRALQLFDQVAGLMRATDKARKIAYFYPYCYYNQKDYTLASYYFKRYTTSYPNTEEAEECLYMSAYCNYLSSPEYSLDQTITNEALKELQLFTNTYPNSKRVSECNDLIDQLRLKLALKDYKIAKMYNRMDDYAASIQMFNNILKEYPETPYREEILFLIVKSYYNYAKESVFGKQKERYSKAIGAYNDFISQFPESKHLGTATDLKEKSKLEFDAFVLKEKQNPGQESSGIQLYSPK